MRVFALAGLLSLMAGPALAERLAIAVSNPEVQVSSSFDGETMSIFGTIEPDPGVQFIAGPYNVVIVVTGPLEDRVTRLKTNSFGLWTNSDQVTYKAFPSFYQVIASGKLAEIATENFLYADAIRPQDQARIAAGTDNLHTMRFGAELVRLMTAEGHLGVNENGINFLSNTAFTAQVKLPNDVVNGLFIAHAYVLKDGVLVAENTGGFKVQKTGFERFVGVSATQSPLLYGLVCVILALGTGWLAGVAFKR